MLNDSQRRIIKNRKSYKDFLDFASLLKEVGVPRAGVTPILRKLFDVLDNKQCYGSRRNALSAQESLTFFLNENNYFLDI